MNGKVPNIDYQAVHRKTVLTPRLANNKVRVITYARVYLFILKSFLLFVEHSENIFPPE